MRIEVSADDIAIGGHKTNNCPLALAVTRAAARRAHVGFFRWWWPAGFDGTRELPETAKTFREAWDKNQKVAPFAFDLDLEAPTTDGPQK